MTTPRPWPAASLPGGQPACRWKKPEPRKSAMQAVKMYTTAVCPYCVRAKQLLKARGVEQIEELRIDADPAARQQMTALTGRRTVPQIFIGQTHVGGYDDLVAPEGGGRLMRLMGAASSTHTTCEP